MMARGVFSSCAAEARASRQAAQCFSSVSKSKVALPGLFFTDCMTNRLQLAPAFGGQFAGHVNGTRQVVSSTQSYHRQDGPATSGHNYRGRGEGRTPLRPSQGEIES